MRARPFARCLVWCVRVASVLVRRTRLQPRARPGAAAYRTGVSIVFLSAQRSRVGLVVRGWVFRMPDRAFAGLSSCLIVWGRKVAFTIASTISILIMLTIAMAMAMAMAMADAIPITRTIPMTLPIAIAITTSIFMTQHMSKRTKAEVSALDAVEDIEARPAACL